MRLARNLLSWSVPVKKEHPAAPVLVIDIGGSHVKMLARGQAEPRRFDSHDQLTPDELVAGVRQTVAGWRYDRISLGYPGRVGPDGPLDEPGNLGNGWVGFDFERALGCPVRVANDAAMQALGAYAGGRMLFLGLGTGLGSALVIEHVVIPLELGCLPSSHPGQSLFERLGREGLARNGEEAWVREVAVAVDNLRESLIADYVVLGGGNAERVNPLPPHVRRGGNDDAFTGGFRLWDEWIEPHDRSPPPVWRVVR